MPAKQVTVIGAAGTQAQAMLEAAARAGAEVAGWVAVDRTWRSEEKEICEAYGMAVVELDLREDPGRLRDLIGGTDLVANFAGPYYRSGTAVLEACVDVGCDYLDVCDDADVTLALLDLDADARAAGVRALVGMGSSPGIANVLVRTASDALGSVDDVSLSWVIHVADLEGAALQHFWHSFAPITGDGTRGAVPAWEDLSLRIATFPAPLGDRVVVGLAHPEPITLPRFLGIETVRCYGNVLPEDALVVNWALARLGASGGEDKEVAIAGSKVDVPSVATALYESYLRARSASDYLGSGLVVDVWAGEEGIRFASADRISMEEATGVPAAAGVVLMLEGGPSEPGVISPECLEPPEFFSALGRASRGAGSLGAYRLDGCTQGERIRIRDLLKIRSH